MKLPSDGRPATCWTTPTAAIIVACKRHAMKFYGKAETATDRIVSLFKSGNLPKALAPVFIRRRDNVPCRAWSWSNQLLVALAGHSDARGFRQWESAGRHVRKGGRAFAILGPCTRKVTERDGESGEECERFVVYGFKSIAVFGLVQTGVFDADKWAAASRDDRGAQQFIDALPLVSVARAWSLTVETYNGRDGARWADTAAVAASRSASRICLHGLTSWPTPQTIVSDILPSVAST